MTKISCYIRKSAYLPRLALVVFLIYVTIGLYFGRDFSLLSNVDLIFHEAGHWIFSPLGITMQLLGGTIMQLLIPGFIVYYFTFQYRDFYASGIALWWLGENLTNVSIYVADAQSRALPLLGGDHDWFVLLNMWRALDKAELISNMLWHAGVMMVLTGIMWSLMYSHKSIRRGVMLRMPGRKKLNKAVYENHKKNAKSHATSCAKHWEEVAKQK